MKNRTIAILVDYLSTGGVQKAAISEALYLKKLGFKTTLIVLANSKSEKREPKSLKIEYLYKSYPWILKHNFKLPIFHFLSLHHLLSPLIAPFLIKNGNYDLILSHGSTTTLAAYTIHKFQNIPYITFIHDPMPYILEKIYAKTPLKFLLTLIKFTIFQIEKSLIKNSKYCVLDSKVHEKYILNDYKTTPQIIHLSVDPPKKVTFKKSGNKDRKILSFGRWDRGKHPQILLNLALSIPKVKMIIAGNWTIPEDLGWFKDLIGQMGLKNRVELVTSYDQKNLQELASQSFVWVHPHFEAFSLSALEAANLKLPIIIPKGSGVTELFEDGKHGFFPKGASTDELKKPILWLLNNPKQSVQMGILASKIVEQNFSHQTRSLKLKKLILKTLEVKVKIIALECAHVGKIVTAGGDLLLFEMAKRIKKLPSLTVILSKKATSHWSTLKSAKLIPLPSNYFESSTNPFLIFINYTIKSIQCFLILKKHTNSSDRLIIYSSTDSPPDVLPAYFLKLFKPSIIWIARVHHLFPPPGKRPGNYFVNSTSKLIQNLSLYVSKDKADVTIALNQNIHHELLKKGFKKRKTAVIQAGVDLNAMEKIKQGKKIFDAIYLGRIHKIKGVYDLVPIWQHVVKEFPKAKLAVVGTGSKEAIGQLLAQILKSNLNQNISYQGYLSDQEVNSTLKASKLFLFTDHEAGFGLAAAQALACGLPLIGWDIGILGQVYQKGFKTAQLSNHLEFARQITQLLKNSHEYEQLIGDALLEVKNHTWKKVAKDFEKLISIVSQ